MTLTMSRRKTRLFSSLTPQIFPVTTIQSSIQETCIACLPGEFYFIINCMHQFLHEIKLTALFRPCETIDHQCVYITKFRRLDLVAPKEDEDSQPAIKKSSHSTIKKPVRQKDKFDINESLVKERTNPDQSTKTVNPAPDKRPVSRFKMSRSR